MRRPLARIGSAIDAHERAHEMFRADQSWVAARQRAFYAGAAFMAAIVLAVGIGIRANRPPPAPPAPPPEPPPGAVTFDIKPQGEIYIDGALKGTSPPLKRIQLPAGKHVVEVRNGALKPMVVDLVIGSGEEFAVEHAFGAPSPPVVKRAPNPAAKPRLQQQQKQQKSFWDRVADWFHGR